MGLGKIGGILNDITGASSAAAQSQKYAIQSAQLNNAYQKEFAQNAHQWEVEDLKKAGLNPILSAGGGGASASGGGVASATETSAGLSPIDAIGAGISAYTGIQNAKQVKAVTENTNADTLNKKLESQIRMLEIAKRLKLDRLEIEKMQADIIRTRKEINLLGSGKAGQWLGSDLGGKISEKANQAWDWLSGLFTAKGE